MAGLSGCEAPLAAEQGDARTGLGGSPGAPANYNGSPAKCLSECPHSAIQGDATPAVQSDSRATSSGSALFTTRIATFNIENFYTNKLYLDKLLSECQIIALQEHWLYHFEQRELVEFCNERGFNVVLKSVDDADPLPPQCRPRGRGEIAMIWKKNIDQMVSPVSDGNNRVQGLVINSAVGEVCILNVYMQCRGSRDAEDNYRDVLAQIAEIMNIYSDRARFILVGDMNASLTRDIPTSRDLVF